MLQEFFEHGAEDQIAKFNATTYWAFNKIDLRKEGKRVKLKIFEE